VKVILSLLLIFSLGLLVTPVYADNFSYSPLRGDQSPDGPYPTEQQIREDFSQMSEHGVDRIRIFETGDMLSAILQQSDKNNILIDIGIDLTPNQEENKKKIAEVVSYGNKHPNVNSYIVGANELWDDTLTVEQLIENLDFANSLTDKKISTINGYELWKRSYYHPIAEHVDFITVNMFYQNNTTSPSEFVDMIVDRVDNLEKIYEKEIIVESGFSTSNSSKILQTQFLDEMDGTGISHLKFEWADEFWKDSMYESGFGIKQADREEKPIVVEPVEIVEQHLDPIIYIAPPLVVLGAAAGVVGYVKYKAYMAAKYFGTRV